MKTFFSICVIATAFSCSNSASDTVRDFIPGTYIRYSQHEFGRAWDTLEISRLSETGNNYSIQRRWAYERKLNGVTQPLDYKIEDDAALFDKEKGVLTDTRSGQILSFAPEKKELYAGATAYQKIK